MKHILHATLLTFLIFDLGYAQNNGNETIAKITNKKTNPAYCQALQSLSIDYSAMITDILIKQNQLLTQHYIFDDILNHSDEIPTIDMTQNPAQDRAAKASMHTRELATLTKLSNMTQAFILQYCNQDLIKNEVRNLMIQYAGISNDQRRSIPGHNLPDTTEPRADN